MHNDCTNFQRNITTIHSQMCACYGVSHLQRSVLQANRNESTNGQRFAKRDIHWFSQSLVQSKICIAL